MKPPSKARVRLRFRLERALRWLLALAAGVALVACSWAKATFADPKGPIVPDGSAADEAGNGSENEHRFGLHLHHPDAGGAVSAADAGSDGDTVR